MDKNAWFKTYSRLSRPENVKKKNLPGINIF